MLAKEACTGCRACLNVCPQNCISMGNDNNGFWYPEINSDKCLKCKRCVKVCPVLTKSTASNEPHAYSCINKDEQTRLQSSSGGIFTLIAEHALEHGGVVFGAGFNSDFSVSHSYVEAKEDLGKFRGSKYVQSNIGYTYREAKKFLEQGRHVLFTGTPCQIGGLNSYLGKLYENLITQDIICHGVPSPNIWKKYILYREDCAGSLVRKISFRRKDEGWKRFSVSILFKNDTEYVQPLDKDLYMRSFLKNICLRPSCYNCNFKTIHRESDITLADFWGINSLMPTMDDDKGTSLILVNTQKGKDVFDILKKAMHYKEVDVHNAIKHNSAAVESVKRHKNTTVFLEKSNQFPFDKLFKKYCEDSIFIKGKIFLKRVISFSKRLLKNALQGGN